MSGNNESHPCHIHSVPQGCSVVSRATAHIRQYDNRKFEPLRLVHSHDLYPIDPISQWFDSFELLVLSESRSHKIEKCRQSLLLFIVLHGKLTEEVKVLEIDMIERITEQVVSIPSSIPDVHKQG